jgi:hypothetical protein
MKICSWHSVPPFLLGKEVRLTSAKFPEARLARVASASIEKLPLRRQPMTESVSMGLGLQRSAVTNNASFIIQMEEAF